MLTLVILFAFTMILGMLVNVSREVATTIRRTMAQAATESFLQAETNHDASRDLLGDGYQGTMNYAAFTRPLWQWLLPPQPRPYTHGKYPALPNLPAQQNQPRKRQAEAQPNPGRRLAGQQAGQQDKSRNQRDMKFFQV